MENGLWRKVLAGLLIGVGCVLPGVSGGVMAVSFGLYRPMLDAVLGFFHDTRRKIAFLLPLALGGGVGMLLGVRGLALAMTRYEKPMLMLFTGFILGGIPAFLQEADGDGPFDPRYLRWLLLGLVLALPLTFLPEPGAGVERLSAVQAFVAGLLEGVGTVVPGISTSFLLIDLGWYRAYLTALGTLQWGTLAFVGAGFALSAWLCMKAVAWLMDHARAKTDYTVLGFLLVSVALSVPGLSGVDEWCAGLGMLAIGAVSARWIHQGAT